MIVSDLDQAAAALKLAAARPAGAAALTLVSEPEATRRLGCLGWLELFAEARRAAGLAPEAPGPAELLDCGEEAGHVLAALRLGARALIYRGDAARRRRLEEIAAAAGARLLARAPPAIAAGASPDWLNHLAAELDGRAREPLPPGSHERTGET